MHTKNKINKINTTYKIIIVGDQSVGKTSLMTQYTDQVFNTDYLSTIGVDFRFKVLNFNNENIRLQIWDTAGQERFRSINSVYYREVHGVILVYDITQNDTLNNIKSWYDAVKEYAPNAEFIIVGNKSDLKNEQIYEPSGLNLAEELGCSFVVASSRNSTNVKLVFDTLVEKISKKI